MHVHTAHSPARISSRQLTCLLPPAAATLCLHPPRRGRRHFAGCRQALESFTPRQLRLMFVLQPWEKKMNYGEQVRQGVHTSVFACTCAHVHACVRACVHVDVSMLVPTAASRCTCH